MIIGLIPARYSSTRLNGKPLLFYSISLAKKIKNITKIFVSTDSKAIAQYAKKNKAYVINRPKNYLEIVLMKLMLGNMQYNFSKRKKYFSIHF